MTLDHIAKALSLKLLTEAKDFSEVIPTAGYTSDMLSCVMAGAPRQGIWVTLQAHVNIVAVAALLDLAAVIITEDALADPATIAKANEKGVTLFSTASPSFEVVGRLWELGIRVSQDN
jgi:hypothetical protein